MNTTTYIIIAGIGLAIPQGLSTWLKWQTMKVGSAIPTGSVTGNHGKTIGWAIQFGVWILAIRTAPAENLEWSAIGAVALAWFLGGWIATLIERKVYGNSELIGILVHLVSQFNESPGILNGHLDEMRRELLEKFAPTWWRRMMSTKWKNELHRRLAEEEAKSTLQPTDAR